MPEGHPDLHTYAVRARTYKRMSKVMLTAGTASAASG